MTKLSVSAPNIEKLSLVLIDDYQWNDPPSLYLPNLTNLNLYTDDAFRLDIIDVSSVRDINIHYSFYGMYRKCYDPLTANEMLVRKFEGTEVFRLSRDPSKEFDASTNLLGVEFLSPYVTPQLKTITVHGYWKSWKGQLRLIEFLLKGATVLDKLVIVLMKHRLKEAEELEFINQVLSFPKASPSARVIFA
ncbi:uncharacterized protein LOC141594696 [Silene latifolia]|uniref:uncharacterized protein LOC141594696 n=1 Tax=Silene latifolia TaxID=37657 RepID=UPI003D775665